MQVLRGLSWPRVVAVGGAVVALGLIGFAIRGLTAPVERAGNPTIAVTPVAGTTTPAPSSSPSAPPSSAAPSATAPATPKSTMKSSGKYVWSTLTVPASGSIGAEHRYTVAVETSAGLKANSVAAFVAETLNDPRSWTGDGKDRFSLVPDPQTAAVTIYLASTRTVVRLCGSDAEAAYTCRTGSRIVINAERWKGGPLAFANADALHAFLVNHAVGHFLGKKDSTCPSQGKRAPIMQQQAGGLAGCTANPWPNG